MTDRNYTTTVVPSKPDASLECANALHDELMILIDQVRVDCGDTASIHVYEQAIYHVKRLMTDSKYLAGCRHLRNVREALRGGE